MLKISHMEIPSRNCTSEVPEKEKQGTVFAFMQMTFSFRSLCLTKNEDFYPNCATASHAMKQVIKKIILLFSVISTF